MTYVELEKKEMIYNIFEYNTVLYKNVINIISEFINYRTYESILSKQDKLDFINQFAQNYDNLFDLLCDFENEDDTEYKASDLHKWILSKHNSDLKKFHYNSAYNIWGHAVFMIKHSNKKKTNKDSYLNFILDKSILFQYECNEIIKIQNLNDLKTDLNLYEPNDIYNKSTILESYFGNTLIAVGL